MNRTTTVLFTLTVLTVLAPTTARAEDKELRINIWLDREGSPLWDTQDEKKLKEMRARKSRLLRKLIVASDAVIYHPGKLGAPGKNVSPLAVFHQLKTDDGKEWLDKGGKRYLRVGKSDGESRGWLEVKMPARPEERLSPDVAIWGTRLLLDPNQPQAGTEPFAVFKDPDCKDKLAVLRRTAPGHRNFAPILRRVGKEADHLFEVAFFSGEVTSRGARIPKAVREAIKPEGLRLEVMFVIDTTASMTPMLEATKEVIANVVKEVKQHPGLKGSVRIGLVEYQDLVPGLTPARLVSALTGDLEELQKTIAPLRVSQMDSEDWPEDVLAGLDMAIEKGGWTRNSTKHIILIGDASAQLEGRKNTTGLDIKRIIDKGRRAGVPELERALGFIGFHAVRVIGENQADYERCEKQFKEIAMNNEEFGGVYETADVNSRNPKEKNDRELARVVKTLTDKLNRTIKALGGLRDPDRREKVVDVLEAMKGKRRDEDLFSSGLYQILEASIGQPKPLMWGYASTHSASKQEVAKIRVYVEKGELDRFRSTLDLVYTQLKRFETGDSIRNPAAVLRILHEAIVNILSGQTCSDFNRVGNIRDLIADLPLTTLTLELTPNSLAKMSAAEYLAWLRKLKTSINVMEVLLNSEGYFLDISDGTIQESYTFLRLSEVP